MTGPTGFELDELGPTEGSELDDALEAIGALELVAGDAPVRTGPAFSDRIMAALADEPVPGSVGFLFPLRRRGLLRGFTESVRQAWASIGSGRPTFARAAALAYVLVVAIAGTSLVGAASFGAAGALGLFESRQTIEPTPSTAPPVAPTPTLVEPTPSTEPEPSESPEAAEPSDDHGGGEPEASDDHGGNSGPGGGGDDSGGSDDGAGAHETDDHSGSDDGSGGGGGSDDGSGGEGVDD